MECNEKFWGQDFEAKNGSKINTEVPYLPTDKVVNKIVEWHIKQGFITEGYFLVETVYSPR